MAQFCPDPVLECVVLRSKCSFQFWVFEKCKRLGLELMTISVQSRSAETAKGVRISLSSTAQIKILTGNGTKVDLDKVELAAQHFLGYSRDEIQQKAEAAKAKAQAALEDQG